ncbi:carbohydrate-binding protein [Citrobacter braakii]|uniref:carbohydrate-binding protein n=1 Tax=Citrobacter braakii TaxID=57706 RepID=UPI00242CB7CC|nr:carbohydrate-binding protein [Citrobacter braakii]WFY02294.1 carbohydrate-binding protein [Citrobacter braakii]
MSKIARYQGNVRAFASDAQGMERTVFGGTNQADDLTSQITASFLRGWGIVGASEHPSLEDFNAAMYAMSQFIAYQHQMGVPEWHAEQEYHIGSICTHNGESYQSLQNANIGSQPPSAKWTPVLTSKNGLANLGLGTAAKRAVGGGANQIPDMGFFQAIIATGNTLLKFPFIDQYGNARTIMVQLVTIQTTGGADKGYPLPYAFPNAGLFATGNRATSGYNAAMNVRIANATTVSIQNWANDGALEDCCVIAVGW